MCCAKHSSLFLSHKWIIMLKRYKQWGSISYFFGSITSDGLQFLPKPTFPSMIISPLFKEFVVQSLLQENSVLRIEHEGLFSFPEWRHRCIASGLVLCTEKTPWSWVGIVALFWAWFLCFLSHWCGAASELHSSSWLPCLVGSAFTDLTTWV